MRLFAQPTLEVARALLGSTIVVDGGGPGEVRAVLVEVEAYRGTDDPASHAYRGPTPRAGIMFGPPGRLYVYLSYGIHHCANLVCEPEGTAGAVLLRAARVVAGEEVVRARRAGVAGASVGDPAGLLRGPGNLCRGLGLTRADNGIDVAASGSRVTLLAGEQPGPVLAVPRIGISAAAEQPWRFLVAGDRAVSRPPAPGASPVPDATRRGPGSG